MRYCVYNKVSIELFRVDFEVLMPSSEVEIVDENADKGTRFV